MSPFLDASPTKRHYLIAAFQLRRYALVLPLSIHAPVEIWSLVPAFVAETEAWRKDDSLSLHVLPSGPPFLTDAGRSSVVVEPDVAAQSYDKAPLVPMLSSSTPAPFVSGLGSLAFKWHERICPLSFSFLALPLFVPGIASCQSLLKG